MAAPSHVDPLGGVSADIATVAQLLLSFLSLELLKKRQGKRGRRRRRGGEQKNNCKRKTEESGDTAFRLERKGDSGSACVASSMEV